jgi:type II restriction/modification system DNA methylase subunit YeeA
MRGQRSGYPRHHGVHWAAEPVNPSEFAVKWMGSTRPERAASQEHFIDICRMINAQTPNEADPTGDWYAFEKGAEKLGGEDGFADVWRKGRFAWEYKGKKKDLKAAYKQLLDYREALENPPLLVVCDLNRFEVHTNFTNTVKRVYSFDLNDLLQDPAEPLRILRALMEDPASLRPTTTRAELTEQAAGQFAGLAASLDGKGNDPQRVAHFLDKVLFCLFAEDAGLLPSNLIRRLADGTNGDPDAFASGLSELFAKMSVGGGLFGAERVGWFNGGLFDGPDVIAMDRREIKVLSDLSALDWSQIEPAIFGTLFERGLDPSKRGQLGAHYTDRASIERVVDPVVLEPLRHEFQAMKERALAAVSGIDLRTADTGPRRAARSRALSTARGHLINFLDRLDSYRVLDPACGSGNFLYIALQALKDLEREAIVWASTELGLTQELPRVGPQVVHGLEVNVYAAELARVVIWIGELQWMLHNGFAYLQNPILRPLQSIEVRDAVVDRSGADQPQEPYWPPADAIISNPPFIGGKLMRTNLGGDYVDDLFAVYDGRVPREADFVAYWFEKARAMIASGAVGRAGLLATQGIRGGASRKVLERIKETGDIFMAWSDEPWVIDGAAVHVSIVGFDDGTETERRLDGHHVTSINANLTSGIDLTRARRLRENLGIAFMGDTKGGPFDLPEEQARKLLARPNPDGRSNADVVRPWVNGLDLTGRRRNMRIVDFGVDMPEREAALYEAPFAYVLEHVKPFRQTVRRQSYRAHWWLHMEPRTAMRQALQPLPRYLATTRVSKHRLFIWLARETLPDSATIVFASGEEYFFGILQSRVHDLWARGQGTQLREVESGFRYTPTTCLETFPFPQPTHEQREAIADVAHDLDRLRNGWLNPPDLSADELGRRTLTNLYNQRPTWLANVHDDLDRAVLEAYGWPADLDDDSILDRLLNLNLERLPA